MLKKIFSPLLWGNLVAMLIVGIALFLGALFLMNSYTQHGREIVVPNLQGKSFDEAEKMLQQLDLKIAVRDTGYIKSLPADVVLDQSITKNKTVKPGRTIYVIVNSAHARAIALPDIADNCSVREAEAKLTAIGFQLSPTERINGDLDWVYAIKVNGRNVPAGTRIFVDQKLTLVVGNGRVDEHFNGNDSLDYLYFSSPETESGELNLMENGESELPTNTTTAE